MNYSVQESNLWSTNQLLATKDYIPSHCLDTLTFKPTLTAINAQNSLTPDSCKYFLHHIKSLKSPTDK